MADEYLLGTLTVGTSYRLKLRTMWMTGVLRAIVVGSNGEPITLTMDVHGTQLHVEGTVFVPWNAVEHFSPA